MYLQGLRGGEDQDRMHDLWHLGQYSDTMSPNWDLARCGGGLEMELGYWLGFIGIHISERILYYFPLTYAG